MTNHNHKLSEGDELTDTTRSERDTVKVVEIHDDGGATLKDDLGTERVTEQGICASLRDGLLLRDGKGPELVESY